MGPLSKWAVRCSLMVLMGFTGLMQAQVGTSTLTGRVVDSTGAVVPGVKVTLVDTDTNFQFSATTNADGLYRVPELAPGPYRLTFDVVGFKRLVRENITLRAADVLAVDVGLEVGNVNESINVTTAPPLLETETSSVGTLTTGQFMYTLPSYQRLINLTLHLEPGMTEVGAVQPASLAGYHVGGQRATTIGLFEDGVTGNDPLTGTTTSQTVMNSVAETKVLSTTLPAEYGHSAGGVIAVVRSSGTNTFHGMAAFQGRTRSMMQRRFFDVQKNSQTNGPLGPDMSVYCQPDGNLAGPVFLPKVYDGRNKTFFFFGWQHLVEKKSAGSSTSTPTPQMENGDFSFGGIGVPIYDPRSTQQVNGNWMRTVFPNQQIPLSAMDPVARKIVQINPWQPQNAPGSFNANGPVTNLLYNAKSRQFTKDFDARIDQQLGSNLKFYFGWTYNSRLSRAQLSNLIQEYDYFGSQSNSSPYRWQNYSVGATKIFTNTLVNDFRVGYLRQRTRTDSPEYGTNYGQILGIPNIPADMMPAFNVFGLTATGPALSVYETVTVRDDVMKVSGKHAFKMGYEVLRNRLDNSTVPNPSGSFVFSGMTAGLQPSGAVMPVTGNDFAGFLLGAVSSATFSTQLATWLPRSVNQSAYFQDDWRLLPHLTLNLGIRYSNESPYNTKYGQQSTFGPNVVDPVTGRMGGIVHPAGALNQRDNNNFQPRIGLAWNPRDRWVFRGGFAVYMVDIKYPALRSDMDEYTGLVNDQQLPGNPNPAFYLSQGPASYPHYTVLSNGTSPYVGTNYSSRPADWWDSNLRNPYVLNWNASVQRQLSSNYMLEVMYQGSSGVGLLEAWNVNTFPVNFGQGNPALQAAALAAPQNYRPYPQFGNILYHSNTGHSTFHSGTVKLEKAFSRGLTLETFYTFSKAIDSSDCDTCGDGVAPIQDRRLEKARAGYDRNHMWVGAETWQVPVGRGRHFLASGRRIWDLILGGYNIDFIQSIESGNPLNFTFANNPNNEYPTWVGDWRPNVVVSNPSILPNWRNLGPDRFNQNGINPVLNINDFAYPGAFTPGNAGRNIVTGLPLICTRGSIMKVFRIKERYDLQLRADMMNPFHIFNLGPPTTTVDFKNPNSFGKLTGTNEPLSTAWGGQPHIDLMVRFSW